MFQSARLRLTLWYMVIVVFLSMLVSGLFYVRTVTTLEQEYVRIEQRFVRRNPAGPSQISHHPLGLVVLDEDLAAAKREIAQHLLTINTAVAVFFAAAGYVLSGKTLRPIQHALDEQKRFVTDASHELRTPITSLKTSIEVYLMNRRLTKRTRAVFDENLQDITRLESLTDALLRLARSDSQEGLIHERVSVAAIVNGAAHSVRVLSEKQGNRVDVSHVPRELNVRGDRLALEKMLTEIIENAIKYSPKKRPIRAHVTSSRRHVIISVEDSGIGIEKVHIPYIFDRFYRVDAARSGSQSDGYGLGLSIVKKTLEQHGGSIEVDSTPTKGSRFSITLPKSP